jgi:hypothetical protein
VEPKLINRDTAFVFELVGPFATVFVLDVLPFRADAFFKEMIVGFESEFGGWGDVILGGSKSETLSLLFERSDARAA